MSQKQNDDIGLIRDLKNSDEIQEFIEKSMTRIIELELINIKKRLDLTYSVAQLRHGYQKRESGEAYFTHLRAVAEIVLHELPNPTIEEVMIALLHDSLEDTSITYDTVQHNFGPHIADAVLSITKLDWRLFTTPEQDVTIMDLEEHEKSEFYQNIEGELKERRNKEYFGNMCYLSKSALKVKLADRVHNLRTLEACPPKKIRRKIRETEIYFLDIAKEQFPDAYLLIITELQKLNEKHTQATVAV